MVKNEAALNFYFTVVDGINSGKTLTAVAQGLGLSKQNLNYRIRPLKVAKVLKKIGKVWQVDQERLKHFLSKKYNKVGAGKKSGQKSIRGHGYAFRVRITGIDNWHRREEWLLKRKISYKSVNGGQSISVNVGKYDFKVHLCSRSLVIYYPEGLSFTESTAYESFLESTYLCKQVVTKLESLFNVSFKIRKYWDIRVKCFRQHYGKIQDELAKHYNDTKNSLQVYDNKGQLRLLIDNSFNLNEFEAVHPSKSLDDMDKVVKPVMKDIEQKGGGAVEFFEDVVNHYDSTGESLTLTNLLNVIGEQQKTLALQIRKNETLRQAIQELTIEVATIKGRMR